MSDPRLRLAAPVPARHDADPPRPLGRYLVEAGLITPAQLVAALEAQMRLNAPLGRILVGEGLTSPGDVLDALAQQNGLTRLPADGAHPDPTLFGLQPAAVWLRHRAMPWMRLGRTVIVATERPGDLPALRAALTGFEPLFVIAPEARILHHLAGHYGPTLARRAEGRVAPVYSCRGWGPGTRRAARWLAAGLGLLLLAGLAAPTAAFAVLSALAVLTLALISGLKLIGFVARLLDTIDMAEPAAAAAAIKLPRISMLVPLFHETEIASTLVERLCRLSYPKALLDVILVLEEADEITAATLQTVRLPPWMRVLRVPAGTGLTTKPRALNYALDFCEGDIVGVWDAEDAPAPDQLDRVAHRFAATGPRTACLQGVLDYYNPRATWLSRCFTIEYASWFRLILPGIARLGLVVPLGGTTLFVRRAALERLGGWDAHNVTEDADLGLRLARFGYRTEIIPTVTGEEATCRPWPWVRQRTRWLKGFMVTWLVHMRAPRRLLADLGWARFLGVQAFFIGTLSQFLLAPLLWSFWLIPLGMAHPIQAVAPPVLIWAICGLFFLTELVNLVIGCTAVSGPRHRFLMGWVLTLPLYFPLGAVAAWRALFELLREPYRWDKTQHGQSEPDQPTA